MTGYTRQSSANMITGNTMYASDFNNEFNAIQSAFDGSTGHSHDGTTGNGPKINLTTSVSGILPVANGGSGGINNLSATTAPTTSDDSNSGYRVGSLWVDVTNDIAYICVDATIGTAIWIRHQVYSSALASIAGLTTSANQTIYTTGSNLYGTTALTAFGRSLIDDVDATTARGTLGLGTIATQAASSVTITGGTISGITDITVADGGTGASTAAGARTNLGLVIGTDVQAQDAELQAIAGLTSAADKLPYFTGSGTAALADFTSAGRALIDDVSASAQRTTLGLGNVDNTSDINKPVSSAVQAILDDPWYFQPIGGFVIADDGTTGFTPPPTNKSYRYIELTLGLTGSGQYNNGVLTSESLSGTSPTINATAVITLSGSPFDGQTIRMINTERRFLRAGSAGTLEDSQVGLHGHTVNDPGHTHSVQYQVGPSGTVYAGGQLAGVTSLVGPVAFNSQSSGTGITVGTFGGNETRARNIGVRVFRRIK